jgi:release factor glutamine methyltransferase
VAANPVDDYGEPSYGTIVQRLRLAGCVFAEDEAALLVAATDDHAELEAMLASRVAGVPLEHVLGWAEFCGLRVAVGPGVFVPRPRTEVLVGLAVARSAPGAVVLDLCCGSGAVGLAVAAFLAGAVVYAADLDPVAVAVARRNLPPERVFEGDLFDALPGSLAGAIDALVVVAPYVPTGEISLLPHEARDFEPWLALDGGDDGLDTVRRIVAGAAAWLAAEGCLFTEVSELQAPTVVALAEAAGLHAEIVGGETTVVIASR